MTKNFEDKWLSFVKDMSSETPDATKLYICKRSNISKYQLKY